MSSEKSRTAAEAVQDIQNVLRSLTGSKGLGIIPDQEGSKLKSSHAPRDQDIHKLSAVSLAETQHSVSAALDALKSSVQARESWNESVDERLLKVKRDTVSNVSAITASRAALIACRRIAVTSDPFASRSARAFDRLRCLAEDSGAVTFKDDSMSSVHCPACELSVSGSKFNAIFSFSDLSSQSVNVDVQFQFLTDAVTGNDHAIGLSFSSLLRRERFGKLKIAFDSLMKLENLDKSIPNVSLCDALYSFEDSLLEAQRYEQQFNSNDAKSIGTGHGVVQRTALGLHITFMKGYSALLGVEPSGTTRQISVSRSPVVPRASSVMGPFQNFEFGQCDMTNVHAQYVLKFNRPIIVSLDVARALERVAGGEDMIKAALRAGSMRGTPVREMTSGRETRSDYGEKRGLWPNLQMLLAPAIFGRGTNYESETVKGSDGTSSNAAQQSKKRPFSERSHWSLTATEYLCYASLPGGQYLQFSHSGGDVIAALAIHRVPIRQPREVQAVLAVLRQQIVFNELFQSCFGHPTPIEGRRPLLRQAVEVVLCETPSLLQLSLFDEVTGDILSLVINIGLGGDIRVALKSTGGRRYLCSDRKATALLRLSRSIPLTIRTVLQVANNSSGGASNSVMGP